MVLYKRKRSPLAPGFYSCTFIQEIWGQQRWEAPSDCAVAPYVTFIEWVQIEGYRLLNFRKIV
ncbi:hypothetical protein PPYC1_13680 [Paenibacillus polymyxa]|nr:hypothetical protein PPYC1_13680 [Paenibacillus polymyxa]